MTPYKPCPPMIANLKARIAELEKDRNEWQLRCAKNECAFLDQQERAEKAESRVAVLENALRKIYDLSDCPRFVEKLIEPLIAVARSEGDR